MQKLVPSQESTINRIREIKKLGPQMILLVGAQGSGKTSCLKFLTERPNEVLDGKSLNNEQSLCRLVSNAFGAQPFSSFARTIQMLHKSWRPQDDSFNFELFLDNGDFISDQALIYLGHLCCGDLGRPWCVVIAGTTTVQDRIHNLFPLWPTPSTIVINSWSVADLERLFSGESSSPLSKKIKSFEKDDFPSVIKSSVGCPGNMFSHIEYEACSVMIGGLSEKSKKKNRNWKKLFLMGFCLFGVFAPVVFYFFPEIFSFVSATDQKQRVSIPIDIH